ncbi:MAG: FHA domain-containing protein [Planctomycetaceae bacterium]|nr:FHA domain-containing protein [Planctomycetaceae bacterium]
MVPNEGGVVADATLLVIQGPDQGRRFELTADENSIGRGAQNEVRILDTEVSRRHAVIRRTQQGWKLQDLNSSNGTWVDGKTVQEAFLQPGQQIQLGRTMLLFGLLTDGDDASAVNQIDLIAQSSYDDQSRIVGQTASAPALAPEGWMQAGANLQILYRISEEAVRPTSSVDELLKRILDLTLESLGADRGCMLVADSKTDQITPRVVSHRPQVDVNQRMPISTSIVEYVISHGHGVRTSDAQHDSRFDGGASIAKSGIREAMCVPMHGRYELMGVIYVDTTVSAPHLQSPNTSRFNDQQLRLLLAIGRQSALAIENFRYQDALVTAERLGAVGQTVTIMSHHIKNILQGVRGGSYLIDQGLKQDNRDMIRQGWSILEKNHERIYNLVMDMLTFSKERRPQLEDGDIEQVIGDILELMQPRMEQAGIELRRTVNTPPPHSWFDPEGMHRALLNIVTNAVDVLEGTESPFIDVRSGLSEDGQSVWIEVEDNGAGIPPEVIPHLFHLFESTKGNKGTGLGLAVSRKILEEHGGSVSVRSEVGRGTCFRLEWPAHLDDRESAEFRVDPNL